MYKPKLPLPIFSDRISLCLYLIQFLKSHSSWFVMNATNQNTYRMSGVSTYKHLCVYVFLPVSIINLPETLDTIYELYLPGDLFRFIGDKSNRSACYFVCYRFSINLLFDSLILLLYKYKQHLLLEKLFSPMLEAFKT